MNTDESAWSRRGTEPIVGPELRTLAPRQATNVDIRGDVSTHEREQRRMGIRLAVPMTSWL